MGSPGPKLLTIRHSFSITTSHRNGYWLTNDCSWDLRASPTGPNFELRQWVLNKQLQQALLRPLILFPNSRCFCCPRLRSPYFFSLSLSLSLSHDCIGLLPRDPARRGSACSPWRGGRGSLLPAPVAAAPSSRRGAPRGGGGGSEAQRPRLPPRRPSPTPAALAPLPGAAWRRGGFRTRRLPSGVACPTRWLPDARRLPSPPPTRWLPNAAAPLPYLDANDEDVRLSEFVHGHEIGERMTGRSHMSSSARMDLGSMF